MKSSYQTTQRFYSEKAEIFFEETLKIDLSQSYEVFLKDLNPGALILDLGCGSGRDTQYFREHGYSVESWEPNEKLASLAEKYLGSIVNRQVLLSSVLRISMMRFGLVQVFCIWN